MNIDWRRTDDTISDTLEKAHKKLKRKPVDSVFTWDQIDKDLNDQLIMDILDGRWD